MGLSVYYTVPAAYTEASKRAETPVIEMPGRPPPLPHFLRVSKVLPLNLFRDRFSISAIFGNRGRWQARGPGTRGFRVLGWKPGASGRRGFRVPTEVRFWLAGFGILAVGAIL